jgi:predicted metal-dependent phosphoesterase TrpH
VLKVELHAHTDDDPADRIPHSIHQLVDRAAALGYGALAVTLHDRYFDPRPHAAYARERGVVLLAGIERTVGGRHVLLINFSQESAAVRTLEDVAALKAQGSGLVVAPHPFYPTQTAAGHLLERYIDVFDAIEINAFFTSAIDFNRRAIAWAQAHGKPLVGNSDLHVLRQMGTTYSLVDADPDADAICDAIRRGRVEVRRTPLSTLDAIQIFTLMSWGGLQGRLFGTQARTPR